MIYNVKRIVALAASLSMLSSVVFTGSVFAEGSDEPITGYTLTAEESASGDGWTWSPTDGKLSISDATIDVTDDFAFNIESDKDVTVDVEGMNSLTVSSAADDRDVTAIKSNKSVKFVGGGALNINMMADSNSKTGIDVTGDISVSDNTIISSNIGMASKSLVGIKAVNVTVGNADSKAQIVSSTYDLATDTEDSYTMGIEASGLYKQLNGATDIEACGANLNSLGLHANGIEIDGGDVNVKVGNVVKSDGTKMAIKSVTPIKAAYSVVNGADAEFENEVTTELTPVEDTVSISVVGAIELKYSESNSDEGTFDYSETENKKDFEINILKLVDDNAFAGYKVYDADENVVANGRIGKVAGNSVKFAVDFAKVPAGEYTVHSYVSYNSDVENEKSLTSDVTVNIEKVDYTGNKELTVPVSVNKDAEGVLDVSDVLDTDVISAEYSALDLVSGDAVLESAVLSRDGKITWRAKTGADNEADQEQVYTLTVSSASHTDFNVTVKFISKAKNTVDVKIDKVDNKVYDGEAYKVTGKTTASIPAAEEGSEAEVVDIDEYEYSYYSVTETVDESGSEPVVNKDYTPIDGAPVNAGKYKVVISVSKYNEEYEGATEAEFEITKRDAKISPKDIRVTKGSAMPELTLEVTGAADVDVDAFNDIIRLAQLKAVNGDTEVTDTNTTGNFKITWASDDEHARILEEIEDAGLNENYNITVMSEGSLNVYRRSSGGGGGSSASSTYTVTFNSNGGTKVDSVKVSKNGTVKEPAAPTKDGFKFTGWYTDKELTKSYDFSEKVTKSFTLYAKYTEIDHTIVLKIGDKQASVFGNAVTNDVAPVIKNDRTMLPARFVAESLGAKVEWDETAPGIVTITKGDTVIVIRIGEENATVNGTEVKLDSPAFIENDRTYTPVRFVAESLGATVEWQEGSSTVTIIEK